MAKEKSDILVVIPAYNEEANISSVIDEVKRSAVTADIIVVDDGSRDKTAEIAEKAGVGVLRLPFNCGIGASVQTGFKYARDRGYAICVQIDGDGQHDAAFLPSLVKEIKEDKVDVVIGSRFLQKEGYKSTALRMCGIWIFQKLNSFVLGQYISDSTSGFRAYNKRAINFLAEDYPRDYPEPEAVVTLGLHLFTIKEVPIVMRQRKTGVSSINRARPVYYMTKVLLAIFMNILRAILERRG